MVVLGLSSKIGPFAKPGAREYEKAENLMKSLAIENLKDKSCSVMSGGAVSYTHLDVYKRQTLTG